LKISYLNLFVKNRLNHNKNKKSQSNSTGFS